MGKEADEGPDARAEGLAKGHARQSQRLTRCRGVPASPHRHLLHDALSEDGEGHRGQRLPRTRLARCAGH